MISPKIQTTASEKVRKRLAALAWHDIDLFGERLRLVDLLMRHQKHPRWRSPAFRRAYLRAHYCDITHFYEQACRNAQIYNQPEMAMFRVRLVLAHCGAPLHMAPDIYAYLHDKSARLSLPPATPSQPCMPPPRGGGRRRPLFSVHPQ